MKEDLLKDWTTEGLKRVLAAIEELEETGTLADWEEDGQE